jgi:hypothetical protein
MRFRLPWVLTIVLALAGVASAEEEEAAPPTEPAAEPAAEPEPEAGSAAPDTEPDTGSGSGSETETDTGTGTETETETETGTDPAAGAADPELDPEDPYAGDTVPAHLEFDADGDGKVEPDEQALSAEFAAAFKDIPHEVTPKAAGTIDLENPGMTVDEFKNLIRLAKAKVLARLQAKMAAKQDARMAKIGRLIFYFSLGGVLLLLMPLVLKKKYPGKTGMLFKYSGLAAVTFFLTVNFFGGVVIGMRTAQGALGGMTNPQLKVAEGFFDSLAAEPDKYLPLAKDLFGPTMYQLQGGGAAEQPAVALIENGQRLIEDAKVFTSVARAFEKIDFVFAALPIVLLAVTLILFVLAIRPTLTEIIKMPSLVAAGDAGAGKAAVKNAGRRVVGEVAATLATVGVLVVLSLIATVILGKLLLPALDLLIQYFAVGVLYLQLEAGASSGLVFVMMFAVIIFLVLNLAAIILAMAFFLGKSQKIFQQRFNAKVPLAAHTRFWKWGIPAVLGAMLVPLLYMLIARAGIEWLSEKFMSDDAIAWGKLMIIGPMILVFGFLLVFWAARGVTALKFLATYKVKPAEVSVGAAAASRG